MTTWKEGDIIKIIRKNVKKTPNGHYSTTSPDYYFPKEYKNKILTVKEAKDNGVYCYEDDEYFFLNEWVVKPTDKERARYLAQKI